MIRGHSEEASVAESKTSKAEQAYVILKQRIMDGTFGPGQRS